APPSPAEASALRIAHQMSAHLLLHPVADIREAPTRVSHREVVHPAPQDGVKVLDDLPDRPRPRAPKDILEGPQQCRSLFQLRRILRPPCALATAHTAKIEPQEAEALSLREIDDTSLLFIDCDFECC